MRIPVTEARNQLGELVNRASYTGERVILTRHDREVAAIVPLADVELLDQLREQPAAVSSRDQRKAKRAARR